MFDDALILLEPDEIQPVDVLDTGRTADPVEIIRMGVKMAGGFADQARDQVGLFRTRMPDGDVGLALCRSCSSFEAMISSRMPGAVSRICLMMGGR